ncbi:RNA-binding protein 45-like isoform X1 [Teleopsis dalmanni]|uniref:RNA-binding protein 45-like isoform X1 n=2 Tax=Teleopsis dalmanni TaxID=139649 RepID=UPI0018CCA161|nr:RNA-binding protein 45-like isoform X1 [Teleopsis dalmanni]XP_037933252.1 RNA-binding protein 45-like isoform X1 [Teleopsis dalmanni]
MSDYRSQSRDGGRGVGKDYSNDDDPPMSRLFIICNKSHNEDDFREAFSQFGEIEDIWIVKNKHTHENKGIAYIKFAKTSDAAKAQEEMNGKTIGNIDRTLKVLVAANRNQGSNKSDNEHEKYVRLFIVCSKQATEEELRDEFSKYGDVERITIVKDKATGNPKGFGYVRYSKFYHAALAFENCSPKYKAVFAEPKGSPRTQRDNHGRSNDDNSGFTSNSRNNNNFNNGSNYNNDWKFNCSSNNEMSQFLRMQSLPASQPTCLEVIASNLVNQDQLWRLFDIIPGLDYCRITREYGPRTNEVTVAYDNPEAAAYAKNKLHGLEFPIGERIIVKLAGMNNTRMDSSLIDRSANNDSIVNVSLPPMQPMASPDEPVAQRLFIVLAGNVPLSILKNVFSCWKGLIDVYLLRNKNCGYVKYAEKDSAQKAIQVLHGAEICGTKLKVMEAEERNVGDGNSRKRLHSN